jgi:hypothetical protein
LEEFRAALYALWRGWWLRRYYYWSGRFLFLKSRRESFDVRDQVNPFLA